MPVRDRRSWMNKATDPVLELLEEELVINGRGIYYTLSRRADNSSDAPGRATIYRALDELADHGLVSRYEDNSSYFQITAAGRRYLAGEPLEDTQS